MRPARLAPLALLALAACANRPEPAPVVFRGTDPGAGSTVTAPPQAGAAQSDSRGVVDYGGYTAIVARDGDTVDSMAARIGISAGALASYNGLPIGYRPRAGDELILPPSADRLARTPPPATAPIAPVDSAALPPPAENTGFDLDRIEASIDDAPEAEPAPPAPNAAAPEPVFKPAPGSAPVAAPVGGAVVAAAPPVSAPSPAPQSASNARFQRPVDGPIVRGYSRAAGPSRNEGVDFAAPVGAPVTAAADGTVALVSESLGGLGTIILVRHDDGLLTVYGRVEQVGLTRGAAVRRGQQIGIVAPGAEGEDPYLHFEVRRGADSVDPEEFLG